MADLVGGKGDGVALGNQQRVTARGKVDHRGIFADEQLSWLWVGAAILLGIGGFFYQWMRSALSVETVDYQEYRNPGMPDKAGMRPM